jgi:hypothetical protein
VLAVRAPAPVSASAPRPAPIAPKPSPSIHQVSPAHPRLAEGNGDAAASEVGRGGLRRILIALAQRNGLTKRQIGIRAGLSSSSGTFDTYMSRARAAGWVRSDGDRVYITDAGLEALGSFDPLPTGRDLLNHWLSHFGNSGVARILTALANAYPQELSKEQIGDSAGLSPASGTFDTYMSRLRSLELIQRGAGATTKASDELFDVECA